MSDHEINAHEPETSAMNDGQDAELREVLQAWRVPEASPALDNRIYALYREASNMNLAAETLSTRNAGHASETQGLVSAYQLPDEQKTQTGEEVKMKRCSTCQEEFADKFSFCPVDGTPLNAYQAAESIQAVETPIEYDPDATIESAVAFAGAHAATNPVTAATPHDETAHANFAHYEATPATGNGNGASPHVTNDAAHINDTHLNDAIDGETVTPHARPARGEYNLTIIQDAGVTARLAAELRGVAAASQLTYPEFKRDPAGFTKRVAVGYGTLTWNTVKQPNNAIAIVSSIFGMALILGLIFALNSVRMTEQAAINPNENVEFIGMFRDVPEPEPTPEPKPDREGASGNAKGTGGGAKPAPEKAQGGGGGGREEPIPASKGKLPTATLQPQVLAPDPKPPRILNPTLPTAATIRADPVLFPPDNRPIPYGVRNGGDIASSGTGKGGGIGTGTGGGVGTGSGTGVGAGRDYNTGGGSGRPGGGGAGGDGVDYNKVFPAREVTSRAVVLNSPEPTYTEEGRKNQITGKVGLRVVFSSNGQVTNIVPTSRLPYGLTEKAIEAARKIKFKPAMKNGRAVSQYQVLTFSFNIY